MKRTSTKRAAEAILAELPSVLGAYVREDVHGHPREVHILVGPKPDTRLLSRDVRELLEERLGIPIDQRVISIAQISASAWQRHIARATPEADGTRRMAHPDDGRPSRPAEPAPTRGATANPPSRLVYAGLESEKHDTRIAVRVRLVHGNDEYVGEAEEMDAGAGRTRAAAQAALAAITEACAGTVRLDLESASVVQAFGRDYALVAVLAGASSLGRHPVPLAGAHSIEAGAEMAAIFATLKATNRIVARALDARRR